MHDHKTTVLICSVTRAYGILVDEAIHRGAKRATNK
jgi:hypothetical protein